DKRRRKNAEQIERVSDWREPTGMLEVAADGPCRRVPQAPARGEREQREEDHFSLLGGWRELPARVHPRVAAPHENLCGHPVLVLRLATHLQIHGVGRIEDDGVAVDLN